MKNIVFLFAFSFCVGCKQDVSKTNVNLSPIDAINARTITPSLVDSLNENRMDIISDIRKRVGYHCGELITTGYLYFKITIDSNGKYSNIEVPPTDGVDHEGVAECIKQYFLENEMDLGLIREMPDSKYGSIPREKTYTLRVF